MNVHEVPLAFGGRKLDDLAALARHEIRPTLHVDASLLDILRPVVCSFDRASDLVLKDRLGDGVRRIGRFGQPGPHA